MGSNVKAYRKIFVLDTSVILYDHNAIMNFEEHDVAIPIPVLEELDEFKKGSDTKNFEAREFIRMLDKKAENKKLTDWISLNGDKRGKFRVIMATPGLLVDATEIYGKGKNDHSILNAALFLQETEKDRPIILVTKDINLRLKAKALNLQAEDYLTGRVKESDTRFSGRSELLNFPVSYFKRLFENKSVAIDPSHKKNIKFHLQRNLFYILKSSKSSALGFFNGETNHMELVEKSNFYGVKPRNSEQTFALNAIMNPAIKLVTLTGVAGTGKTLLALAGSLEQRRDFKQIYLARPIVPLSNRDIGFLPGDAEQKINPYMQPLWDNLKFIKNQFGERDRNYLQIDEMIASEKILVTPLAYIRGRSLSNVIFIVDEAQNLTPHEIKTIITRAGENSKIIFTGDIHQIDTPYLDEQSNGLSYIVDRLRGQALYAHITLEKGERSELANLANDLL
ncbi:MAG: PhoH-like protein [Owenweeksia sp. TMED14]|nr:MAG: PhoH-like protein [Owenweeksia sp. TMED14]